MYFRLRAALLALSILLPTVADAADYPKPNEGNFALRDFKFASGETLPELRLHYRTLGKAVRDDKSPARWMIIAIVDETEVSS